MRRYTDFCDECNKEIPSDKEGSISAHGRLMVSQTPLTVMDNDPYIRIGLDDMNFCGFKCFIKWAQATEKRLKKEGFL